MNINITGLFTLILYCIIAINCCLCSFFAYIIANSFNRYREPLLHRVVNMCKYVLVPFERDRGMRYEEGKLIYIACYLNAQYIHLECRKITLLRYKRSG